MRGGSAGRSFFKPFFPIRENFSSNFGTKFCDHQLRDIIGSENIILSFSLS